MTIYADSVTPLINSIQPGRVFVDLELWVFYFFIFSNYSKLNINNSKHRKIPFIILGIGVSTITNMSIIVLLGLLFVNYYYYTNINFNFKYDNIKIVIVKIVTIALITSVFTLFIPQLNFNLRSFLLFLCLITLPIYIIFSESISGKLKLLNLIPKPVLPLVFGLIIGILFFGGPMAGKTKLMLEPIFNSLQVNTAYSVDLFIRDSVVIDGVKFFIEANSEHLNYLNSFANFNLNFFLIFALGLIAVIGIKGNARHGEELIIRHYIILSIWGLAFGLFVIKTILFQGAIGGLDHLKTRFTEPWIISLLIGIFIYCGIQKNKYLNILIMVFTLIWTIGPEISGSWQLYKQIIPNINYIKSFLL